jgi:hypothetical protein
MRLPPGPPLEDVPLDEECQERVAERVARCFDRNGVDAANELLRAAEVIWGTQTAVDIAGRAQDLTDLGEYEAAIERQVDAAVEDAALRRYEGRMERIEMERNDPHDERWE